jgi:peptide/nickel transport system permease protein
MGPLARYIIFRLALAIPAVGAILVVTFVVTHVLPGDPAIRAAGPYATKAAIHYWQVKLGLTKSLGAQLMIYLGQLARGDLGTSNVTGSAVATDLLARLPATLELITLATAVAFVVGVGLAVISAERDRGVWNHLARVHGALGTAVPDYVIVFVLIALFYSTVHLLPVPIGQSGASSPAVPAVTGAYFLDAILAGNLTAIGDGAAHLVLPVSALAFVASAPIGRVARAAIEDARRGVYVDYAVMMSGSTRLVRRYVLENALPPVLTITGLIYSLLIGSDVIIETVVGWGGIGQYGVAAVMNNDYFAIQGFVLIAALFSLGVFLIVDIAHAVLDPRVRAAL